MSEEYVVNNCAPTLAGIKTGSLFSCRCQRKEALDFVKDLNTLFIDKGLLILPLKIDKELTLFYVYRPEKLKNDLSDPKAVSILKETGYKNLKPEYLISTLAKKLKDKNAFPHEIGLFLGYPPDDVKEFMRDKENCTLTGYWKVYKNVEKAKRTFSQFDKCFRIYKTKFKEGFSLKRLTVNTDNNY